MEIWYWIVTASAVIGICWTVEKVLTWLSKVDLLVRLLNEYETEYHHEFGEFWYSSSADDIALKRAKMLGGKWGKQMKVKDSEK